MKMDEEMIRRLLNREYPNLGRNSYSRCREDCNDDIAFVNNLPCQSHVHEFELSTIDAQNNNCRHNHRYAGITSEVIPLPCGQHKHAILTSTDSNGHHHEIGIETGPAIEVGKGKHIHFVFGETTLDEFHFHRFQFTTEIQNPTILENYEREYERENRCECKRESRCECENRCECRPRRNNR